MPYLPDLATVVRVFAIGSTVLVLGWGVWAVVDRLRHPPSPFDRERPVMKPRRPTGRQWWG